MAGRHTCAGASTQSPVARFEKAVRLFCTIAVLAGALSGCAAPRPKASIIERKEWDFAGTRGTYLRTEHWQVYTTCPEYYWSQTLPDFLEACYAYYSKLVPAESDLPQPMTLYLFSSRLEWERFTRRFAGPQAEIYLKIQQGAYTRGPACVVYKTSRAATLAVIAHEGMHQYLWHYAKGKVPAWIAEGLATLCEGFTDRNGRIVFDPASNPLRYGDLRAAIQCDRLISLQDLLNSSAGSVIAESGLKARTYYAQLWAMMQFLSSDRHYRKGFRKLRAELCTKQFALKIRGYQAASQKPISAGQAAFMFYITEDLQRFWAEYLNYVARLTNLAR